MSKKINFVIDNEGTLESHEMLRGKMTEDEVQDLINSLVNLDIIYLGERTEGDIKISTSDVKVYFKHFTEPDWSEYDEYTKQIELDKIYE
jgi:hypothetical protein